MGLGSIIESVVVAVAVAVRCCTVGGVWFGMVTSASFCCLLEKFCLLLIGLSGWGLWVCGTCEVSGVSP